MPNSIMGILEIISLPLSVVH